MPVYQLIFKAKRPLTMLTGAPESAPSFKITNAAQVVITYNAIINFDTL